MVKRIGRRFVSLLLTFVTILTMLPAMTLPALAATSGTLNLPDKSIGLSYSGDADGAWTTNGTSITGAATSTGGCSTTHYSSTLTIKNEGSTTARLSFSYTVEVNEGRILVDKTNVTANGTFTKELALGDTVEVKIKSGSTAATKITMTDVKLEAGATATVTFQPAENGSYTVDGKDITTEAYTNTQSSLTAYKVIATPADGYQFLGWYDATNKSYLPGGASSSIFVSSDNSKVTAKFGKIGTTFQVGTSNLIWDNLNDAIISTRNNSSGYVKQLKSCIISGEYTIPSGVTLLIPFDEDGTLYTDAPAAIRTAPASKPFRTLTMSKGTSITVNGAISLGGSYYAAGGGEQGRPVGDYGYIKMADNSSITVKNGGNLYAWGFISGSGSVLAESGATVYEFYQIADFRGGSASSGMGNKVFPFSQYFVQNIEVPLTLNAGANEQVYTGVYAAHRTHTTAINFIGDTGMFKVESGSFTKDYDEKTDRLVFTVNGEAALNTLSLKLAGMNVNSASYVLPITNNITINIQSGNVTINQDAALLAGVEVNIAEGAGLTVASEKNVYVYDADEWNSDNFVWGPCKFKSVAYAPGKAYNRSNDDLVDAKMDVNGSVTAIGAIYTTEGGADICSSKGTGKYIQQGTPGTETATYQYNADSKSKVISITAAKLHNVSVDKPYTETKDASTDDNTFTYCTCPDCGNGKWTNGLKVAEIIDGNSAQAGTYATLQKAVEAYTPDDSTPPKNYIKMLHNTTENITTENITTTKDIYLDLNGRTVTGIFKMNGTLYGMDSTTDDYVGTNAGKIVGSVAPYAKTFYQTGNAGDTYNRYVAIPREENGKPTVSFHRFNISVTGYRFELATGNMPECALFFIGKFQGDKAAKDYLTSLGITLTGDNGPQLGTYSYSIPKDEVIPEESKPGDSPVVHDAAGAYLFEAFLKRSFEKDPLTTASVEFSAIAKATFGTNGETQKSETKELSFQQALWDALSAPDMEEKDRKILMNFLNDMNIPNPNP